MDDMPFEHNSSPNQKESLESRFLGTLRNGEKVFDRPRSLLEDSPELRELLSTALWMVDPEGEEFIATEVHFDQPIGKSECVETTPEDKIVYAKRIGKQGYSRFVVGREPEETQSVSLILKKIPEGYILISAYIGAKAPLEPWAAGADETSREFWKTHALRWGSQPIMFGTDTEECPWEDQPAV